MIKFNLADIGWALLCATHHIWSHSKLPWKMRGHHACKQGFKPGSLQSHRSTSSCLCDFREITSPLWASISSALRWRHNSTWASNLVGHKWTSSHVWMWELDYKESWGSKNWCFWSVVLEKTLESPWDCKEIQSVHPKGDQSWVFIGRTDVEAKTPILWPPDAKSWLIWKDPDAGKDWGQEEKGTTEDEMVGWHHWLNGHEFG